ncbi:YdcF family protein [Pelomicrobium methylotrophicum]|uniref:YdcF family protein n=1 Tax=Pelomicrobium methylotrophicum TaxID=2602750 RepID=A0A5C7EI05_9PROT|nr:YdcF family protein [Pelomicrobium methylotrophicum]TXF10474.1 YdcF family protein [Pelomicrobium methylotrophicum]
MTVWHLAKESLGLLLLPPASILLLLLVSIALFRARPGTARSLLGVAIAALWIASTPAIAYRAQGLLETAPLTGDAAGGRAQAIVVLGGGMLFAPPEYSSDTVSRWTLERLRYAARLQRETRLPVLVTGGNTRGRPRSEAAAMKEALEADFGVPVRWTEEGARNTLENALRSKELLGAAGVTRILLVTHAVHMPRARLAFEAAGFEVVPAPTGYAAHLAGDVFDWMPRADALLATRIVLHEAIGYGWYRLQLAFR